MDVSETLDTVTSDNIKMLELTAQRCCDKAGMDVSVLLQMDLSDLYKNAYKLQQEHKKVKSLQGSIRAKTIKSRLKATESVIEVREATENNLSRNLKREKDEISPPISMIKSLQTFGSIADVTKESSTLYQPKSLLDIILSRMTIHKSGSSPVLIKRKNHSFNTPSLSLTDKVEDIAKNFEPVESKEPSQDPLITTPPRAVVMKMLKTIHLREEPVTKQPQLVQQSPKPDKRIIISRIKPPEPRRTVTLKSATKRSLDCNHTPDLPAKTIRTESNPAADLVTMAPISKQKPPISLKLKKSLTAKKQLNSVESEINNELLPQNRSNEASTSSAATPSNNVRNRCPAAAAGDHSTSDHCSKRSSSSNRALHESRAHKVVAIGSTPDAGSSKCLLKSAKVETRRSLNAVPSAVNDKPTLDDRDDRKPLYTKQITSLRHNNKSQSNAKQKGLKKVQEAIECSMHKSQQRLDDKAEPKQRPPAAILSTVYVKPPSSENSTKAKRSRSLQRHDEFAEVKDDRTGKHVTMGRNKLEETIPMSSSYQRSGEVTVNSTSNQRSSSVEAKNSPIKAHKHSKSRTNRSEVSADEYDVTPPTRRKSRRLSSRTENESTSSSDRRNKYDVVEHGERRRGDIYLEDVSEYRARDRLNHAAEARRSETTRSPRRPRFEARDEQMDKMDSGGKERLTSSRKDKADAESRAKKSSRKEREIAGKHSYYDSDERQHHRAATDYKLNDKPNEGRSRFDRSRTGSEEGGERRKHSFGEKLLEIDRVTARSSNKRTASSDGHWQSRQTHRQDLSPKSDLDPNKELRSNLKALKASIQLNRAKLVSEKARQNQESARVLDAVKIVREARHKLEASSKDKSDKTSLKADNAKNLNEENKWVVDDDICLEVVDSTSGDSDDDANDTQSNPLFNDSMQSKQLSIVDKIKAKIEQRQKQHESNVANNMVKRQLGDGTRFTSMFSACGTSSTSSWKLGHVSAQTTATTAVEQWSETKNFAKTLSVAAGLLRSSSQPFDVDKVNMNSGGRNSPAEEYKAPYMDAHFHMTRLLARHKCRYSEYLSNKVNIGPNFKGGVTSVCDPWEMINGDWHKSFTEPTIYGCAGAHPRLVHHFLPKSAQSDEPDVAELKARHELLQHIHTHEKAVAVGETGLELREAKGKGRPGGDPEPSLKLQQLSLGLHVKIAKELNKPLVLHMREAVAESLDYLRSYQTAMGSTPRLYWHNCLGDISTVIQFLRNFPGSVVGLSPMAYENYKVNAMLKNVPLDAIVLETDIPHLFPTGEARKSGLPTPAYMLNMADKVANLRNMKSDVVLEQAYINTLKFYNID